MISINYSSCRHLTKIRRLETISRGTGGLIGYSIKLLPFCRVFTGKYEPNKRF